MKNDPEKYSADQLVRLSDVEHVRKRPGMYLGGLEEFGRLNLLLIVLDDALMQVLAGEVKNIWIKVCADGSWSISNDGRGIPVERNDRASEQLGRDITVLEAAFSCLRYGSFEGDRYRRLLGLIVCEISVVNFLSKSCVVKVKTEGKLYRISFKKGECSEPLATVTDDDWQLESGTQFKFKPDPEVFGSEFLGEQVLLDVLPEFACLFQGVAIHFSSEITNAEHSYCSPNGLVGLLGQHDASTKKTISSVISAVGGLDSGWSQDGIFKYKKLEVVFQFHQSEKGEIRSFGSRYRTLDHGTHVDGFRQGLVSALREVANQIGTSIEKIADNEIFSGVDAVVSVFHEELQYSGHEQRTELRNFELVARFAKLTSEAIKKHFENHPDEIVNVVRDLIERYEK